MKRVAGIVLLGAGALAGGWVLLADPGAQSSTPKSTAPKNQTTGSGSSAARSPYDRALLRPALLKAQAPETFQVKFVTTKGDFTVTVTRSWSPLGADRFYNLVRHHFFDNASFFRVVPNFVVQFGMSAHPALSAVWDKANINDEPVKQSNKRGSLTFAKTSLPNTRSTQVFINLKDNAFLDGQGFAPFGVVDGDGMAVVDQLYSGYGDQAGPDQEKIAKEGKPYLDKSFPKLDSIKSATLVGAVTNKPAAGSAAKKPGAGGPQKP
jgi:peptidyl-prolyl cis-trans isomerase A (cyclophilin A)